MNNEQLTAYLKDESYLYTLSYEELKTLVLQYPYANNLRILLLKKSFLEQNKDYERNLQMAATYSTNRRFLYKLVQKLKIAPRVPENVILGEDYLELTELSNIEKMLSERHVTQVFSEETFSFGGSDSDSNWAELGVSDTEPNGSSDSEMSNINIEPHNFNIPSDSVYENVQNSVTEIVETDIENKTSVATDFDIEEPVDLTVFSKVTSDNGLVEIAMPIFDDSDEPNEVVDLTRPLESAGLTEAGNNDDIVINNNPEVNLAVESILAEFGSLALDFSGKLPNAELNIQPTISFESLDDADEKIETEVIDIDEDDSEPIPEEPIEEELNVPLDWSMAESTFDFESLETVTTDVSKVTTDEAVIDEEVEYFEKLNKDSEILDNQLFIHDASFDFDLNDSDFNSNNEFESEDDIIENIIETTPQYITQGLGLEGIYTEPIDMKKPNIEIEITNQSKAVVIENELKSPVVTTEVSFKDWLRQFKVSPKIVDQPTSEKQTPPVKPIEQKIVEPTNAAKINPIENKHVLDENILSMLFEAPSDLPDNLFGLNDVDFKHNKAAQKDTEEDDSYFDKLLNGNSEDELPKKKKKKKKQMHELAARSILESDDLISETLADILAWQGNNKKAIEMYEQLCLQFPEKNDYFAAKIESLRNTEGN